MALLLNELPKNLQIFLLCNSDFFPASSSVTYRFLHGIRAGGLGAVSSLKRILCLANQSAEFLPDHVRRQYNSGCSSHWRRRLAKRCLAARSERNSACFSAYCDIIGCSVLRLTECKLNGENYLTWSRLM
ncbi:hypothetical protein CRG98_046298 [Punica granatum]|uniref:Uncharacterized protein n=1 Tax=Punica granatum TaxID=22663 RepID=A0A2I0HPB2_PUNGR|nr:hypothetical protein CRG98_046298 [Punica granatum]